MKELLKIYFVFLKVGALTFGGGYSMLPIVIREVCQRHKWATPEEVIECYALSQCIPGVIAVNTSAYLGAKRWGSAGAISAAAGIVTPSLLIILLIASLISEFTDFVIVGYALCGIRAAVCALVLRTVLQMSRLALIDWLCAAIFAAVFCASLFLSVSPIVPILLAAALGVAAALVRREGLT